MDQPSFPEAPSDTEVTQYYAMCRENVTYVLEMLDAMRGETDIVGDRHSARFWSGIGDAIRAFAVTNLLE